jgi:hypothetical protein
MARSAWGGEMICLSEALIDEPVGIAETEAGDRQQTVGNSAQGATVTVTTSALLGIAVTAGLVVLSGHAGPMIERRFRSPLQA